MKTVAYLRVSTHSQDLANQKLTILEFSQKRRFPIDQFIESRISSRQSPLERRIDEEAIEFDGKQDLPTKVMIALFGLFAEVERDLISERTKEGLAAAKAKGKLLGRPKGPWEHPGSTASSKTSGRCWARMSPRPRSPRYWTSPAPPSTTSSRPARSLPADYKARTALMLYFNTNVGATLRCSPGRPDA